MVLLDIFVDLVIKLDQAVHCDCDADGLDGDHLFIKQPHVIFGLEESRRKTYPNMRKGRA